MYNNFSNKKEIFRFFLTLDKFMHLSEADRQVKQEHMKRVNTAYEALCKK